MQEALQQAQQSEAQTTPIYSEFGGDEDLGELVEMYVDEMPGRIQAMVETLAAKDWEGLARLAHQLKGASGSYGFMPISQVAAQLENALKKNSEPEEIDRFFQQTINVCQRAKAGTPN